MLRVIDVDYIRNYELLVTFSDGSKKIVNLEPYLTCLLYTSDAADE